MKEPQCKRKALGGSREPIEYIEEKVQYLSSARSPFERLILEVNLRFFLHDVQKSGYLSGTYRRFLEHLYDR